MAVSSPSRSQNELAVRSVIERWSQAVREHDRAGILADHDPDVLMFDVPPPLRSKGINEYSSTWDLFFRWHRPGDAFDVREIEITAGQDVAFGAALMHCSGTDAEGEHRELDFRLTIGLRKIDGRWQIVHEHHSVPVGVGA